MRTNAVLRSLTLLLLAALPFVMEAKTEIKGNGVVVTREIPVNDYDQVYLSAEAPSSWKGWSLFRKKSIPLLTYKQTSGTALIEITTDENLFHYIKLSQEGSKLILSIANMDTVIFPSKFILNSTSSGLKKLDIRAFMDIRINSTLKTDSLHINMNGVGNMDIDRIDCNYIYYDCNGVGSLYVRGNANEGNFSLNGVGKINATECKIEKVSCQHNGVGNLNVYATEHLSADLSGVGSIKYLGNPEIQNSNNNGVGRIRQIR